MKPRIFVSVPDDRHLLDPRRRALKKAIIKAVAGLKFEVVGFEPEQFGTGRPAHRDTWDVDSAQALLQRCDGVLVLALARTHVHASVDDGNGRPKIAPLATPVPTPYNHLEGALAVSLGLPLLIVAEKGMARDGIFNSGVKAVEVPSDASAAWVRSHAFRSFLPTWSKRVRDRRDVFLGYCSKGGKVASALRASVERAGFTVLDWSEHFAKAGAFILDEIERAATRCRCAVFLFTKDDELGKAATRKASAKALPRDNVLVEAGYFTRARGKARVAIVREAGTKMPADFGGVIYLGFDDRKDLTDVKAGLVEFIKTALSTDGARRT